MAELIEVLEILQVFVFGGLGVVALYHWRRRRGSAEAWAAATFGSLALVVVLGSLIAPEEHTTATDVLTQATVAVIVLFPYLLFRFTATFQAVGRARELIAGVLTGVAFMGALALGPPPVEGEARSTAFQIFVYVILVQWVVLSGMVAWRLWRGAAGEPSVARKRMHTLGVAALGLALAIVLAGVAAQEEPTVTQLVIQLLAMVSAGLFLLGLFPPAFVRTRWRRIEEAALADAQMRLMEVSDPDEVIAVLLPHVSHLLGGRGSLIVDGQGQAQGRDGLSAEDADRIAEGLSTTDGAAAVSRMPNGGPILSVPLGEGRLAVEGTNFTPFFGREESEMLRGLALLAALALNRAELFQRERHMHMQLAHAQAVARIGSWDWDMASGRVTWSDQLHEIFGIPPEDFSGDYQGGLQAVHPDDRAGMEERMAAAVESGGYFSFEHRVLRPDGRQLMVHSEGRVLTDQAGRPVRMVGVGQDITERKRQEMYREQFIANAAHELRTPLTSLLGFVEILSTRRDHMRVEDIEEAYEVMQRSGQRLGSLVNNLLDLTKVQQGHIHLDLMEVPLRPTIHDILHSNPPPSGKNVEVKVPDELKVIADPGRLGQVVLNLVSNAYKYGGSQIVVTAGAEDGEVRVEVTDDGPGVEPHLVDHLFEPFRRGELVTGITGSGLGLAISKMLVEASGGRIWYDSGGPGGARFTVALKRS